MDRSSPDNDRLQTFILSPVRVFRDSLAASLAHRADLGTVEAVASAQVALARITEAGSSTVLLDLSMPCALDIAKALQEQGCGIRVIAIAVNDADHELLKCAEAGICGYVSQESSIDDLVAAIHSAVRGEVMCSPRIIAMLFQRVASLSESKRETPQATPLSRREREIVELLELELSNKAIARRLQISAATVKNHVHNILEKLQVRCRGEAVEWLRNEAALHANRSFFRRRTTDFMPKRVACAPLANK
jgi:two-component system, NarL family, nitrate/nitrite response regulator NarL